ncbi:MAG: PilZ domain-containing protein [Planctomycetota bacterium]
MMGNGQAKNGSFDAWAQTLLRELEQQTPEAIRRQRSSQRQDLSIGVTVRPGNASDRRTRPDADGVTGDVSTGGCRVMMSEPMLVGDVYQLHFAKGELDLPIVYARCVRCRLIREDAFEAGFAFFERIVLASDGGGTGEDLL